MAGFLPDLSLSIRDTFLFTDDGEDRKNVTRQFIRSPPENEEFSAKYREVRLFGKDIFIVHGRETKPVKELKAILKELDLPSVVLHEEASKGKTVVEKLEEYADKVGYVFVILTPDDMGASASRLATYLERHPDKKLLGALKARPRQNVIFEFGYFAEKLGRNRVCYLKKGNPDLPSDIEGMVYISFKKSLKECQHKIIKELKAAGYDIKEISGDAKKWSSQWKEA